MITRTTAILFFFMCAFTQCFSQNNKTAQDSLYETIVKLDSTVFEAYNNCRMDIYASFFSEDLEFYHDKAGLSRSKEDMVESIKKYICGKVNREIVQGSIEVSAIPGFGAIEIGKHRFHNLVEKSTSQPGNFVVVWQHQNNEWKITRVISLH